MITYDKNQDQNQGQNTFLRTHSKPRLEKPFGKIGAMEKSKEEKSLVLSRNGTDILFVAWNNAKYLVLFSKFGWM